MAKIDVYPADLTGLSVRLKSVAGTLVEAKRSVERVKNGLSWEVSAKENIDSGLAAACRALDRQNDKITALASASAKAAEEYAGADGESGKRAQSLLGVFASRLGAELKRAAGFLASFKIAKHAAIAGIFLTGGINVLNLALAGLGGRREAVTANHQSVSDKLKGMLSGAAAGNTTGAAGKVSGVSGDTAGAATGNTAEAVSGGSGAAQAPNLNFVSYDYNALKEVSKGNKDYSNYKVLTGVAATYCLCQSSSIYNEQPNFQRAGCYSTADAIAESIKYGKAYDPRDTFIESKGESNAKKIMTTSLKGSMNYTLDQYYSEVYKQVDNGNPVVLRVWSKSGGHCVTVVGIREGADPSHLTDNDFLIIDPGDGMIKSLSERTPKSGTNSAIMTGEKAWNLRIPTKEY